MKLKLLKKACLFLALAALAASCNQDAIFHIISQEVKPRKARVPGTPTNMVVFSRDYTSGGSTSPVPAVYVAASNKLHWYADPHNANAKYPDDWWDNDNVGSVPQPDSSGKESIRGLAATTSHLYALCQATDGTVSLKRIDEKQTSGWQTVPIDPSDTEAKKYPSLQKIAVSGNRIFVGATASTSAIIEDNKIPCAIFFLNDTTPTSPVLKTLKSDVYMLNDAAYDGVGEHYLSTCDLYGTMVDNKLEKPEGCIYRISDSSFAPLPSESDLVKLSNADTSSTAIANPQFKGIISLENGDTLTPSTILAMDRSGTLYRVNTANFSDLGKKLTENPSSEKFTGAFAVWRDKDTGWDPNDPSVKPKPKWLLVGRGSTSTSTTAGYNNGYREFKLWKDDGNFNDTGLFSDPGTQAGSTVDNNALFITTLGVYYVNHLFQVPKTIDPKMVLFAATEKNGLYSYRERTEGTAKKWQWNAEE